MWHCQEVKGRDVRDRLQVLNIIPGFALFVCRELSFDCLFFLPFFASVAKGCSVIQGTKDYKVLRPVPGIK